MSTHDKARIKWACRRGMLELDVILLPYFEACFDDLPQKLRGFSQIYWHAMIRIYLLG